MRSNIITFEDKDIDLINKSYPKSTKALGKYLEEVFAKGGDPIQIDEGMTNSILFFSPRTLYDFFDTKNINVWVELNKGWWGHANDIKNPTEFANRIDAERTAFLEAFKLLENI